MNVVSRRSIAFVALESGLIVSAVLLSAWVRLGESAWPQLAQGLAGLKPILVAVICQLCFYYRDLYDLRVTAEHRHLFLRLVQATGMAWLLLAVIYYWFPSLIIGRGVFLLSFVFILPMVACWHFAFGWLTHAVGPRERLLLVGTTPGAVNLARELYTHSRELGVKIVGFVDEDRSKLGQSIINPGVIGTIEDIPAIVRARAVDRVVVSLADARGQLPMQQLLAMKIDGVRFDHLASVYEEHTGKIAVENLRPSWLVFSSGFEKSRTLRAVKRLFDVVAAVIGLVVAAPLMILLAVAIKLSSHGDILYHQRRVGERGLLITVHKFRSMHQDAEATTGAVWARAGDDRITRLGGLLRRTRLDELPQLWNVLKGDMSLVGPRPERPEFVRELGERIPFYAQRHVVKPGMTGWAQVRYTYAASVEDALEKLQYDLYYIKHMSVAFDLFILFATVKTVLLRRGA